jgi:acetate kinase
MTEAIIVFNAGSTSLKFGAYALDANKSLPLLCRGGIDGMQADPHFIANDAAGKPLDAHAWGKGAAIDHKAAMQFVVAWPEANLAGAKVIAAGHRVVLGGARFEAPVLIDSEVLDYLQSLIAMEPSQRVRRTAHFHPRQPGVRLGHPPNEELMIAQHTLALVRPSPI